MKNLHAKLKNHGKKVIIHLKRHHRKYLFGALCSGILALIGMHTASTINSTFADEEENPCSIQYSTTGPTNQDVVAYLTGCSEGISAEESEYTFTGNGTHTFDFKDSNGDIGNIIATVDWIDKAAPNCLAEYRAIDLDNVIAYITGCDEDIFQIDEDIPLTYLFHHGGTHEFWFSDKAGNLGKRSMNLSGVFGTTLDTTMANISSLSSVIENNIATISWETTDSGWLDIYFWDEVEGAFQHLQGVELDEKKAIFPVSRAGDVILKLVPNNNASGSLVYTLHESVSGNGYTLIPVEIPNCSIGYDTESPTNSGVIAYLTGCNGEVYGSELEHSFNENGSHTFLYKNGMNNYRYSYSNVTWIDKTHPTCDIAYSSTGQTNQDVVAYLTGCSEEIIAEETGYTFTENGTHTFKFEDLAGNSGEATTIVDRIDRVSPTCDVEYSITGLTNQDVTATLTCDDEDINVTNNGGRVEYTFTGNGAHTFEFQDLAGNTGSAVAEVTGIDKVKPTCDIIYSTTGATTGNVVATLTGCIETITGTETQHTFTGNGTYTFNFQDLAGNTGSTEAAVTWIGEYTGVYEIKSGQQMINLYNQGKAITCNVIYSGDNGHQTNTMYIKSGVINENLMIITGNTRTMLYSLEKDGYIYSWGDMYLDGIGFYIPYELDVYEELKGVDNNIKSGAIITCTTGVEEDSVFDLPDGVDFFNIDTYYIDSGVYFIIDAKETAKTGENIDFTITVMKDGKRFKNFLGYVLIDVIDEDGDLLDKNTYEAPGYGYYYFASSDKGKKTFSNGLKINKTGDYYIRVNSLQEGEGFFPISIKGKNDPTLTGNYFKITVNSKANPGEYTTFTVRAMKDGISYSNYTGTVIFTLSKKDGSLVNKRNYTFSNSGRYTFEASDLGRKIFYSGLKINETGTYILEVNGLNDNFKGSTTINVGKSHGSAEFKYDTLKFNPKYSDEMNEAYQYARYYDITTKDSIKDADMYSGLNRIAMAKMLTNYAENVLGKDNFNTGRNCSFNDVSNSLDKDYDYGVTKACQLGIMGVNMPNNKFYPNGGVTRAEFATALSRLLYGTKDGTEKYYSTHITKLRREGIITNTDPALWELRGYVMLMLKRVAEK